MKKEDSAILTDIRQVSPIDITLPDSSTIQSNQAGTLPLSSALSTQAKTAYIVPKLLCSSLLSFGKFCDDGCWVHLCKTHAYITKNGKLLHTGTRNETDGLWDFNLTNPSTHSCNTLTISKNQIPTKKSTPFSTYFKPFNTIIDDTIFDMTISKQLVQDLKNYTVLRPNQKHHLNVII